MGSARCRVFLAVTSSLSGMWWIPPGIAGQQTTTGILPDSEAWYLPTSDGAGELFIFELGSADVATPAVVLHGGPGGDLTYMLPVARGLTDRVRFVFYDQRGSLRSRAAPESISMPQHVRDLEDLRLALEAEKIHLISHSAGTLLALEYLRAYPERVANVVLTGALPHKNGAPHFDAEYAELWSGLAEAAQSFWNRDEIEAELRRAGLSEPAGPKDEARAALIRQIGAETYDVSRWRGALPMRVNPEAARRTRETTEFTYNYAPLIADHPGRVTVINGEYDYTVGPRGSPLWVRLAETAAPRLIVTVLPDASHLVWRDRPDAFRDALAEALTT